LRYILAYYLKLYPVILFQHKYVPKYNIASEYCMFNDGRYCRHFSGKLCWLLFCDLSYKI